jgi:hypothetical protein
MKVDQKSKKMKRNKNAQKSKNMKSSKEQIIKIEVNSKIFMI